MDAVANTVILGKHLRTRIKCHIPKFFENYIKSKSEITNIAVKNAIKRSSIAGHLVYDPSCANNYDKTRFRILRKCKNLSDLLKIAAILIQLNRPKLCKHKVFDYTTQGMFHIFVFNTN